MEIDASSVEYKKKSIPDNVHTIFNFNLPFAIPMPDGLHEMSLGGKKVDLVIKRIQRKDIEGFLHLVKYNCNMINMENHPSAGSQ